jgi:hypothetical protein
MSCRQSINMPTNSVRNIAYKITIATMRNLEVMSDKLSADKTLIDPF